MDEITKLLQAFNDGDKKALDKLMPLIERELKVIAHSYMRQENAGHILQTTALVNEALMRLIKKNMPYKDRQHFYRDIARRMRRILIDEARRKLGTPVDMAETKDQATDRPDELIRLDGALEALAKEDDRKAAIVECRFFIGLKSQEIADLLGISRPTVERDWRFARAFLKRQMTAGSH